MKVILSLVFVFGINTSLANDENNLTDLSLEELMNVKVKVTTGTDKNLKEAPGIVTVITDQDIKNLGARDLVEILSTVPGFTFGHDVLGNISIISRGIWAQEGRILLLVDGMEMNERSYGTLTLINHYPIDHIKKIEIIRGPGSALYGGVAELGVINIITKSGEDLKGFAVSSNISMTDKDNGRFNKSFAVGNKVNDAIFSVKGAHNKGNHTDRNYTDSNGVTTTLHNHRSESKNEYLNFQTKYKSLFGNYVKDNYTTSNVVLWGDLENTVGSGVIRPPVNKQYLMDTYQLGFDGPISSKFDLKTYYLKSTQYPYYQPSGRYEVDYSNSWRRKVEREVYFSKFDYKFNEQHHVNIGFERSHDHSWTMNRVTSSGGSDNFGNGSDNFDLHNDAVFSQYDLTSEIVNLTAGLRYDKPSAYHDIIVPRFSLTKQFGKLNSKLLLAEAFRAPVIENVSLNKDISPEKTSTQELELGYALNKHLNWDINFFRTQVKGIIVYSYDAATSIEHYKNYAHVRTYGTESEIRYKDNFNNLKLNYSFYKVASVMADPFKSNINARVTLGAPKEKIHLSDNLKFSENFTLTPSVTFYRKIYGSEWDGSRFADKRLSDQHSYNLFGTYNNLFAKNFELGLGINNIFNNKLYYVQPYVKPGDYKAGPYPAQSREYIAKVGYSLDY